MLGSHKHWCTLVPIKSTLYLFPWPCGGYREAAPALHNSQSRAPVALKQLQQPGWVPVESPLTTRKKINCPA